MGSEFRLVLAGILSTDPHFQVAHSQTSSIGIVYEDSCLVSPKVFYYVVQHSALATLILGTLLNEPKDSWENSHTTLRRITEAFESRS